MKNIDIDDGDCVNFDEYNNDVDDGEDDDDTEKKGDDDDDGTGRDNDDGTGEDRREDGESGAKDKADVEELEMVGFDNRS